MNPPSHDSAEWAYHVLPCMQVLSLQAQLAVFAASAADLGSSICAGSGLHGEAASSEQMLCMESKPLQGDTGNTLQLQLENQRLRQQLRVAWQQVRAAWQQPRVAGQQVTKWEWGCR